MEITRENVEPTTEEAATTSKQSTRTDQQTEQTLNSGDEQQQQQQNVPKSLPTNVPTEAKKPIETLPPTEQGRQDASPNSSPSSSPSPLENQSAFSQMEAFLLLQIDRCTNYKNFFETQGDPSMTTKFDTLASLSQKDLELLRKIWTDQGQMPKFKFDTVKMSCVPMNCDVKERQVEIVVRMSNLANTENSMTYVIAEFNFPPASAGTAFSRRLLNFKLNPGRIFCCNSENSNKQYDQIYSTGCRPFYDLRGELNEYDRPLSFHVDKGKSKTLKRKYKPIRLEFYEKTGLLSCDKKIGIVHVNIDAISDEATINTRSPILLSRKETGAYADITVKVREPLVDKKIRAHEEKILLVF